MSVFASTWEIERDFGWASDDESGEVDDEASIAERSSAGEGLEDRSSSAGSSGSDAQQPEKAAVGFFQGMFR